MNPKGSNQKISDKNAWVLVSTLAKPKINGLNPGYLDMAIIGNSTRKSMKGMTKAVLKEASDNCIIFVGSLLNKHILSNSQSSVKDESLVIIGSA